MAPRSKPRKNESSGSDSDSDAPEAISLTQSKKTIQKLDSSREVAIKAGRQSQRMRNQQRDKALKDRAERNKEVVNEKVKVQGKSKAKGKGKQKEEQVREEGSEVDEEDDDENVVDDDPNGLEARMLRAMKEAQDEQSESDEDEDIEEEYEGFEGVHLDEDGESGEEDEDSDAHSSDDDNSDEEADSDLEDDDEEEGEDEEEAPHPPKRSQKSKFNPDHLPDEIFEAAFASQSTKRTFNDSDIDSPKITASRPSKKRKSNAKLNTPKDLVVGSKAIRILPTSNQPTTPSTKPSRKVKRFIDRTLSLKSGKQRGKGWERRPVNIGVLRRSGGPAANFVRTQT